MEQYFLKVLVFLSISVTYVPGERICIVASPNQPCAASCSSNESCLTLNQYFLHEYTRNTSVPAPSNIILELLPEIHSLWLESVSNHYSFNFSHKDSVEIRSDNATIICNNSATIRDFIFLNVSTVQISGIKFIDCKDVTFGFVNTLSIEDSVILRHYSWSVFLGSQVTITGTSFINGFSLEVSSSTLVVKQSTFLNLTTRHNCSNGGAIRFDGGTLIVEETTFKNNSAIGTTCPESTDKQGSSGGAIYFGNSKIVKISSSDFFGNNATLSGGALYVQGGSVEIFNSSFKLNWGGRNAGALYYESAYSQGIVSINGSNFTNNMAGIKGGTLYILSNSYFAGISISLLRCNFSYNSVREQSGVGGVAYVVTARERFSSSTAVSISKSNFIHNIAPGNAGVLHIVTVGVPTLVIDESSFVQNRAGGSGGVIHISSDYHVVITVNQSSFISNQAYEDGGVIYLKSNSSQRDNSLITVDSKSSFTFNTAIRSGGIFTLYSNGGQLDVQTTQICCSNAANLGGVIKACNNSDVMVQEELFNRRDPTDMQCTLYDSLYAITAPTTTQQPTLTVCDNTSIHRKNTILLGFFVLFLVLVLILSIILIYVTCYFRGAFKHKVGTKSDVTDRCVYVPMNESEGTQN